MWVDARWKSHPLLFCALRLSLNWRLACYDSLVGCFHGGSGIHFKWWLIFSEGGAWFVWRPSHRESGMGTPCRAVCQALSALCIQHIDQRLSIASMMDVRRHFTAEAYRVALVAAWVVDMSALQLWQRFLLKFTCTLAKPEPFQRRLSVPVAFWINVDELNQNWISEGTHVICTINVPFNVFSQALCMLMSVSPATWSRFKYLNHYWSIV